MSEFIGEVGSLFCYVKEWKEIGKSRTKFKVSTTAKGIKDRQAIDYKTGETITFMSKLEKRFYEDIVVTEMKNGTLKDYKLQQKYLLQPKFKYLGKTIREINYISDFDLYYSNGDFVVIDTKGLPTADAKIKAKLFKYKYPDIVLKWMSYTKATGWMEYDELQKYRRDKKKSK